MSAVTALTFQSLDWMAVTGSQNHAGFLSVNIVDTMRVVAVTEIIDAKLRYVNTALLYVEFDAKQFPNGIPQVVCNPKGRIIRVPDTYDPETRTYSGTWEGVFKWAWTDNPARIYYDIILNERFGLGQRIDATQIDKWELYRIAQYCDQQVPDGKGGSGTEPRFRCNVYIGTVMTHGPYFVIWRVYFAA